MRDDEKLTPADPSDLAQTLAFALRYEGRKRVRSADEYMAAIAARLKQPHNARIGAYRTRKVLNASRVAPDEPSIDEPQIIEPVFVSGIAQAKVIGGLLYLALFVQQPGEWQDNCQRLIKARLIMPITALMDGRAKVLCG